MDNKTKPTLNMRYYNKEIDDDLPYVGHLDYDEETGFIYDEEGDVVDEDTIAKLCDGIFIYDEEGDVVDEDTIAKFCEGDGKGDDEDEFE